MEQAWQMLSAERFDALLASMGDRLPNATEYQMMTTMVLDLPAARRLATLDPFSEAHRRLAIDLYVELRGRADPSYVPERDEVPAAPVPDDIWTGLTPWSFRDAALVGEHLHAYGQILRHIGLPSGGSVLEYGPGSGQLLLMFARMGYRACGADVDAVSLDSIRLQADAMNLTVRTERALFGEGFAEERFDAILFYEAFHHALEFQALLRRLHARLKPGGRLLLCGEPVVPAPFPGIPYPWGPRLDALSVFCIRRFGWMELGFTHDFLVEAASQAGWRTIFHPFPGCGRAHLYVLEPSDVDPVHAPEIPRSDPPPTVEDTASQRIEQLTLEIEAMRESTSWRVTRPLRAMRQLLRLPGGTRQR